MTFGIFQKLLRILLIGALSLPTLTACSVFRGGVLPVVKVGLIAPFEGPQRAAAYEALYAVKLALKEYNATNRDTGPLAELVALNDSLLPTNTARQQALQQMVIDPAVLGIIGPWMEGTEDPEAVGGTDSKVYTQTDMPVLFPPLPSEATSSSTARAKWSYRATQVLLAAIREAYLESGLSREKVREKLKASKQ